MTRTTRRQYQEQVAARQGVRTPTKREVVKKAARRIIRQLIGAGQIPDPATRGPRNKFAWSFGEKYGNVKANTRSQARALIKKELGINKNDRLPVGVQIIDTRDIKGADQPSST